MTFLLNENLSSWSGGGGGVSTPSNPLRSLLRISIDNVQCDLWEEGGRFICPWREAYIGTGPATATGSVD